jgi:Cdc6-like AAA superfamily ATPase
MLSKILKTLLLTDPSDDLATLSRERGKIMNGSCEWILAQENYLTWLQEPGLQRFRITGRPGIGKTTIFRFIHESLKSTAEPKILLCYYLFDYRHADRRGSTAVLRSLIFQILTQQPFLFGLIRKDFELQDHRYTENFHLM